MISLLTFFLFSFSLQASDYTSELKKLGQMKIEEGQCREMEAKIGQLLYATVYLKGNNQPENEAYIDMARDLNLGGVLPHYYENPSNQQIYDWNQKLKSATPIPTLVGVDYVFSCGLGYGKGVLFQAPADCKSQYYQLQAACHAHYGLNHALGPTVEHNSENPPSMKFENIEKEGSDLIKQFNQYGIPTTLKHFPYTPSEYNLHSQSRDTKLTKETVEQKLKNFEVLAPQADFAMSTHLYNSAIDKMEMATFSKTWVSLLRNQANFQGILMTDALFMIESYKANMIAMSRKWNDNEWKRKLNNQSIFAVRALLAGHDMVFLDATFQDTRKIFNDILYIACENTKTSNELRMTIKNSWKKITDYKKEEKQALLNSPTFNNEFLMKTLKVLQTDGPTCPQINEALALIKSAPTTGLKQYSFKKDKDCIDCQKKEIEIDKTPAQINELIKDIEKIEEHDPEDPTNHGEH
ncbi:MAG: glycoside hydrolase family 3 N-terminal domain-containing protein [Bacteriovoracaceae bacterium]